MIPKKGHRALRRGRASIPGQYYFLTFNTQNRNPYFLELEMARSASCVLHGDSSILSWVVMPDHIHLVIILPDTTLGRYIGNLKRNIAHSCRFRIKWEPNFYDQMIRDEEHLKEVARYLVLNPVRALLVPSARLYPYWNAIWL